MADSKRLQILKAITARIESVMVANGYQFDLEGSVFRGRGGFGDESPLPCIGIFEMRPEDAVRADETIQKDDWFIAVQGYISVDEIHPTDPAHNLMADVKKALAGVLHDSPTNRNPNYMFGNLINDLQIDGGVVLPPSNDEKNTAAFVLKLTVNVTDDLVNPYA